MPAINPLLYDDNSESEAINMPNPNPVTEPTMGFIDQIFEATGTATGNKVVGVWNDIKATSNAQFNSAFPGASKLVEEAGIPKLLTEPTRMREIDPGVTSKAAQVIGTLAADAVTLPLGLPVAGYMATTTAGQEETQRLRAAGVVQATAEGAGDVKMAETALGWGLNVLPGGKYISRTITNGFARVGARLMAGAAIVTGTDYLGGETRGEILEQAGYKDQADQVRAWDGWRVGADLVGGAMLSVGGGDGPTSAIPDDIKAAAQHVQEVDHIIHDSAPGIPATPSASAFTAEATHTAINQIENGQPVNVGDVPGLESAEFIGPAPRALSEARRDVALYEKGLAEAKEARDAVINNIEAARRDGYHEEADHFAENILPGKNNLVSQYESLLDHAKDDLHAVENPNALSRATEEIRPQLEAHAQARTEAFDYANTFESPLKESTPASAATSRSLQDTVNEARSMLDEARNPVAEAANVGDTAAAPQGKPVKLTPEQQQLVDMHYELRQLADATGDVDLHKELDDVMAIHQQQHLEAGQFNVAALCSLGV